MDLAAIRAALAAAAAAVTTTPALTGFGYRPDSIPEPAFVVAGYQIAFDVAAARGADQVTFTCLLLVSRADDLSGQAQLDALMAGAGAGSLKAAIEADGTLGGLCDWLQVAAIDTSDLVDYAGTQYYGARITVEVNADGT
jgi:hypothetical protein